MSLSFTICPDDRNTENPAILYFVVAFKEIDKNMEDQRMVKINWNTAWEGPLGSTSTIVVWVWVWRRAESSPIWMLYLGTTYSRSRSNPPRYWGTLGWSEIYIGISSDTKGCRNRGRKKSLSKHLRTVSYSYGKMRWKGQSSLSTLSSRIINM